MARIFITGSSAGLGLMAGQRLTERGHSVVLHARNDHRASDARAALPDAEDVLAGDLETIAGTVALAARINEMGRFDAIIHNAGIYSGGDRETVDGSRAVFAVNVLAPYVLTSLVTPPQHLIYLSSSMHRGASAKLDDVQWQRRRWSETSAYSETKLQVLLLAFAVARLWPEVNVNAVDPGWVPTRMGGHGATDDLLKGCLTQVELAAPAPDSPLAGATGKYFHHLAEQAPDPQTRDEALQGRLLEICGQASGIRFPRSGV